MKLRFIDAAFVACVISLITFFLMLFFGNTDIQNIARYGLFTLAGGVMLFYVFYLLIRDSVKDAVADKLDDILEELKKLNAK